MFSYDDYNCVLTIDNMDYCTEEYISEWLDSHIDDVLFKGKMTRSYRTGKLEINITVVCYDYVVAVYIISDCSPKFNVDMLPPQYKEGSATLTADRLCLIPVYIQGVKINLISVFNEKLIVEGEN